MLVCSRGRTRHTIRSRHLGPLPTRSRCHLPLPPPARPRPLASPGNEPGARARCTHRVGRSYRASRDRVRRWAEPGPAIVSPTPLPMAIPAPAPPRHPHPLPLLPRARVPCARCRSPRSAAPCAPRGRVDPLRLRLRRPVRRSTGRWSQPQLPRACRSSLMTRPRPSTLALARRQGVAWLETRRMPGCTTTTHSSSRVTAAALPFPWREVEREVGREVGRVRMPLVSLVLSTGL